MLGLYVTLLPCAVLLAGVGTALAGRRLFRGRQVAPASLETHGFRDGLTKDSSMSTSEVRPQATLYCSFCEKSQYEVRSLVAGTSCLICDECARFCHNILEQDRFESQYRRTLRESGKVIVSSDDAACLAWMRTWTTSPPATDPETSPAGNKPSHIVVG